MPKILYFITELDVGGAERVLLKLATHLNKTRFQVAVACLTGRGPLAKELEQCSIPVTFLNMRGKWDWGVVFRLRRLLDTAPCDILHTHLFHANLIGRLGAMLARSRPVVVATVHVAEPRRWHLWGEGWTSGWVDKFVAVSEDVRSLMIKRAKIPPGKILTIPNGVDPDDVPKEPYNIRDELNLPPGCPLIINVGRLTRQKGHRYLIGAATRVIKSYPDAHFLIIGAGPLLHSLQRLVLKSGIGTNIHFLGWRKDAWQIVAGANLFVLPSLWEGMPIALLEAMAVGVPVIGTSVSGISEVVVNGQSGVLVSPADERVLAQAILGLLMNPERARELGEAGRQRVLENFSLAKMSSAHEELYTSLVKRM